MPSVSVRTIASELSVSPGTVSKALKGMSGRISGDTARRIINYCKSKRYLNRAERIEVSQRLLQLRKKNLFHITCRNGILMYGEVTAAICSQFQDSGLHLNTYMLRGERDVKAFPYDEAAVIITVGRSSEYIIQEVLGSQYNIPLVVVDHKSRYEKAVYINCNNLESTSNAVEQLYLKGHKRIGFFCNHEDNVFRTNTFHEREIGYRTGLMKLGLPIDEDIIVIGKAPNYDFTYLELERNRNDLRSLGVKLLKLDPLPTAVVAVNDHHACVLRELLEENGIRVPEDISIIGFDGQHKLAVANHKGFLPVSTMVVDWWQMGVKAATIAIDLLLGEGDTGLSYLIEMPTKYDDGGTVSVCQ